VCLLQSRPAFTLLELLLVLGLLAAVAAMAWPMIGRSLENRQLQFAAEQLRADLVTARAKAINTGAVFVLSYAPQGGSYIIEPMQQVAAIDGEESSSDLNALSEGDQADLAPVERLLPEGIRFAAGEATLSPGGGQAMPSGQAGDAAASDSFMLLCNPDGSTTTGYLTLINEKNTYIEIELRGLTGIVTIGDIQMSEAMLP